jgi:deoxyribodipyrimidine photo-lyase
MMEKTTTIFWLREDLRLADNPALHAAALRGLVVPLYILEEDKADPFPPGGASKWWLQEALKDLASRFATLGAPLILRRGNSEKILRTLIKETKATHVAWNRRYQPHQQKHDDALLESLQQDGVTVDTYKGYLLFDPSTIKTGGGTPYKVYTPFSKACFAAPAPGKILPAPTKLDGIKGLPSDDLTDWRLVPRKAKWPKGLEDAWEVGEKAAQEQLHDFISHSLAHYKAGRDRPDQDYTSRLSPYLHFGHISPRQAWHAIQSALAKTSSLGSNAERYLLELLWREFAWHLLQHFPETVSEPLNASFKSFPWKKDTKSLHAWQKGMTGYPIVDAGMRQLWLTGWMHNRVRMIVASFLIKDLLIDWREGAAWFWDTLVDADLGNNTASWQWVAGSGADAAPYFRIFNPTLQGQKFDPNGDYVRKYVPELAGLDAKFIHEPWKMPVSALQKAGVVLGKTYPSPIIDHGKARLRALSALKQTKNGDEQEYENKDLFD